MSIRINDEAPNFTAETSQGTINFHEWIGDGWAILFSHPKDFTPVCTTELGYMAGLQPEFAKRNCKVIGLSVDPVSAHDKWASDIEQTQGHKVNYPMIGDTELKIAKLYDMLPAEAGDSCEGRTAATNATVRTVFVVGPDQIIALNPRGGLKDQSFELRRRPTPTTEVLLAPRPQLGVVGDDAQLAGRLQHPVRLAEEGILHHPVLVMAGLGPRI